MELRRRDSADKNSPHKEHLCIENKHTHRTNNNKGCAVRVCAYFHGGNRKTSSFSTIIMHAPGLITQSPFQEVCRKLFANLYPIGTLCHHSNFAVCASVYSAGLVFNLCSVQSGQRMAQFSTKRNCGSVHAVSMLPIADGFREFRVSCYSATENKSAAATVHQGF
jgi:hypothetical protein